MMLKIDSLILVLTGIKQNIMSYQYVDVEIEKLNKENKKLHKEVNKLREQCKKLEEDHNQLREQCKKLEGERNELIYIHSWTDLYNEYVGRYDSVSKTLIVNHSYNNTFNSYGFDTCGENYEEIAVKGSWDNWDQEYYLSKRDVTEISGSDQYEGVVYYIHLYELEKKLKDGEEYQYKFKDIDGDWIEPVEGDDEVDINGNYCDSPCQKMAKNKVGSWNACITIKKH